MTRIALFNCCLLLLGLLACGRKPDGTPYGVNPAKHPDGHYLRARDSAQQANSFKGNKIPKAGEMNAITNGARTGQPLVTPPAQ